MVCDKLELHAVEVLVEPLTRPDESKRFFLCLAVAPFHGREGAAGVADRWPYAVLVLNDDCTNSNGAGVGNHLRWGVMVEVR